MTVPEHLRYTKDHYWIRPEGEHAVVGLTDWAIATIGMIVFIELPEAGDELERGGYAGSAETVEGDRDLSAPLSGKVTAVNPLLERVPQLLHDSPYEKGWMYKIQLSHPQELDLLLGAGSYSKLVQ